MQCRKCKTELPDGAAYCYVCGVKQEKPQKRTKARGNGTGCVYKLPNGKWRAEITLGYDSNQKRITKTKSGFKTKKEALEYLPTLKNEKGLDRKVTLELLYASWESSYMCNLSRSKQDCYRIARRRIKDIAYADIRNLLLDDLQAVVNSCPGGYYPKRDIKSLLSQLYDRAVIDGIAPSNMASYIILPPLEKSKKDAFSDEEISALWDCYKSGKSFTGYILIMIYTGMRLGELQKLEREMIDFDSRTITGAGIKSKTGMETPILISDIIKPVLEELCPDKGKILPMGEKVFYKQYYETLEQCKIRKLSPHCCRHTTATALANANVAPAIIKQIMRHSNYQTTTGYTHIDTSHALSEINKI